MANPPTTPSPSPSSQTNQYTLAALRAALPAAPLTTAQKRVHAHIASLPKYKNLETAYLRENPDCTPSDLERVLRCAILLHDLRESDDEGEGEGEGEEGQEDGEGEGGEKQGEGQKQDSVAVRPIASIGPGVMARARARGTGQQQQAHQQSYQQPKQQPKQHNPTTNQEHTYPIIAGKSLHATEYYGWRWRQTFLAMTAAPHMYEETDVKQPGVAAEVEAQVDAPRTPQLPSKALQDRQLSRELSRMSLGATAEFEREVQKQRQQQQQQQQQSKRQHFYHQVPDLLLRSSQRVAAPQPTETAPQLEEHAHDRKQQQEQQLQLQLRQYRKQDPTQSNDGDDDNEEATQPSLLPTPSPSIGYPSMWDSYPAARSNERFHALLREVFRTCLRDNALLEHQEELG